LPDDALAQGNAYIRSLFGVDPEQLQPSRWAQLCAEAYYIEGERLGNLAKLLSEIVKSLCKGMGRG
jgi:hypothetical protein